MPTESQAGALEQIDPSWAWQPYEPTDLNPWTLSHCAHLYRRAGFGATWSELQEAMATGCEPAVQRLLSGGPESGTFYAQADATLAALVGTGNGEHLPAWWLHVMLHTPHPLLEKMTLFWHGHFATSAAKVTDLRLMARQNALLRKGALGGFRPLLSEIAKDPAMLLWLDSATNRKAHPNENFARELMELFSLGLGNYTETDIKEAARAFTGWEVRQGKFRFNRYQHDPGYKTVLGQTGPWTGDDVIRILLEQPPAARFLVHKIYRWLVSETARPPDMLLSPLETGLPERDYDLSWLLRTILSSNLFYSPHAVRQKVKSPVEFGVGLLRGLEGAANTYALAEELENLGQSVFFPPNVKGWDGGTDWINSSALVTRANLVWGLASGRVARYKSKVALNRLSALANVEEPAAEIRRLADLLLGFPLPDDVYVQLTAVAADQAADGPHLRRARLVQAIATLPEFQLA